MDRTESHARKTDRRASYTQKVIKDALLELLGQTPYEKITVAALCRQAEITRATFYLHYLSLDAVLNELLDEAVAVADKVCADMSYEERMGRLAYIAAHGSVRDLKERMSSIPLSAHRGRSPLPGAFPGSYHIPLRHCPSLSGRKRKHDSVYHEPLWHPPRSGRKSVSVHGLRPVLLQPRNALEKR